MNPDTSLTPGEELEIRITALLMGELTPEESTTLRAQLSDKPELQALHTRLARAYDLIRAATPLCETIDTAAPVRLSSERRERLLQQFKSTAAQQPKIIPINRPRWTWLAPLSWAASFIIVLGYLATQFAPREKAVVFAIEESARVNGDFAHPPPEGRVSNYRYYVEAAPTHQNSFGTTPLDVSAPQTAAGDRLAALSEVQANTSRGEEVKLFAAQGPPPAAARPGSLAKPNAGGFAGGGAGGGAGISGATATPPASSTPTIALAEAPTNEWASQPGMIRQLNRSSKEAEIADASGIATPDAPAAPAAPALAMEDKAEFESLSSRVDPVTKEKVIRKSVRRNVVDGDEDSKAERFARMPSPKVETAAEGTFWDSPPAAGQPAAPALPGSGPVSNRPQSFAANGSASDRNGARDSESKLAAVNDAEGKDRAESASRTAAAPSRALAVNPSTATSSSGGVAPELNAGVLNPDPAALSTLAGRGGEAARAKKQSADKKDAVAEPYAVSGPLTTAGRVILESSLNAPTLGDTPIPGSMFGQSQQGQIDGQKAVTGGVPLAPTKPVEFDALKRFGGMAGEKTKPESLGVPAETQAAGTLSYAGKADDPNDHVTLNPTAPTADFGIVDGFAVDESRATDGAARLPYFRGRGIEETGKNSFEFGNRAIAPEGERRELATSNDDLLSDARGFGGTGRLDLAKKRYDQVLAIDPNNAEAKKGLEDVAAQRELFGESVSTETRSELAWKLESKWAEPSRDFSPDGGARENTAAPSQEFYFKQDGTLAKLGKVPQTAAPAQQAAEEAPAKAEEKPVVLSKEIDMPIATPKAPASIPQPEIATSANAFSTFSLNVSDVAFKLAAASLEQGKMPDAAGIRSEEFINAFDYRDPEPAPGAPLAFATERARYPFAQNRDLLRLSIKTAAVGRQPGRPLNLVLLVDNSGSMERADRVRILRESLRVLAAQLQPQDKLSIISFARTPHLWIDGVPGNEASQATQRVGEITPLGGTNLSAALDLAYETARKHFQVGNVNRVVLLTDGAANLGNVNPSVLKQKVEAERKQGVALDCFGVGWEGYNDDLLEQLSRNGDGRYGFINSPDAAATEFAGQLAGALRVAASDVKVQVEFNPKRVTAYRQIGYAKHQLTKEQFRDNTVDAAEIGAAESGNALYAVEVNPRGEGDIATVRARFKVPGTSDYREHEWPVPFTPNTPALEQASPTMRLAATASAFSEWLAGSPYAAGVTTDQLLGIINGVPQTFSADPRPQKLEWMIRQAKSVSGR